MSASSNSNPEAAALLAHLRADWPRGALLEVGLLAPDGSALKPRARWFYLPVHKLPDWYTLARANRAGYGVYYGLTGKNQMPPPGKRTGERAAAWLSVLWCDVDVAPEGRAEAWQRIEECKPAPTAVVDSGGGYHVLWRVHLTEISDDNRQHLRAILRGLALHLHGDTACAELSRMLRLPGFVNTKPTRNGAQCHFVVAPQDVRYDLSAFAHFAELGAPPRIPPAAPPADGLRFELPPWVHQYLQRGRQPGQRNRALFGAAISCKSAGYAQPEAESLLLPRALADGLSEDEARRTIASAYRSAIVEAPRVPRHIELRLGRPRERH